ASVIGYATAQAASISAPSTPAITSAPAPALIVSAPPPPVSVSAEPPPVIEKPSVWLARLIVTAPAAPEASTFSTLAICALVALLDREGVVEGVIASVPAAPSTVA